MTLSGVWHNGRFVSQSTAWWWQHTKISYDELYCVHGAKLNAKCAKCEAKEEKE